MTLTELFLKHKNSDKVTGHSYGESYEMWLKQFKDQPINLLELGVCWFGGGSVLAFADYFPKATIWGVDFTCEKCRRKVFEHPRIKMIEGDVTTDKVFNQLKNKQFEVIVHDCRHLAEMQLEDARRYLPLLAQNGVYIIEDVKRPHLKRLVSGLNTIPKIVVGVQDLGEERKQRKMDDNILIKIKKLP